MGDWFLCTLEFGGLIPTPDMTCSKMEDMKMLILLIVSCFSVTYGQVNAEFKYVDSCYSVGQTLTLEAVYTGSGTPGSVQWSYSEGTGTNLFVVTSSCAVFGSVPAGYPDAARMEYKCATADSLPTNTYRLIVTGLTSDELTKSWGATFTPPTGTAPAAVQVAIEICATTVGGFEWWKILLIVLGILLGLFLVGIGLGCSCFPKENKKKKKDKWCWYKILWFTGIGTPVAFGIFCVLKCRKQDY